MIHEAAANHTPIDVALGELAEASGPTLERSGRGNQSRTGLRRKQLFGAQCRMSSSGTAPRKRISFARPPTPTARAARTTYLMNGRS